MFAFVWTHQRNGVQHPEGSTIDTVRAGASVIALVVMEVVRQFWDSFHYQHFPLWITRVVLPVLYFTLGNSLFRLTDASSTKQASPLVKTESGAECELEQGAVWRAIS
jgi:hypothetical protein